eukprot:6190678-Pleurochrysis_carterae.AAC.1
MECLTTQKGETMGQMRGRRVVARTTVLAPFDDDVCGDVLARMIRRLGKGVFHLLLQRRGMMPQWWQFAQAGVAEKEAQAEAAKAAAADAELDGLSPDAAVPLGVGKLKIKRAEQELSDSKRSHLSTSMSFQLARFASSVCADILARVARRLGDDTSKLLLQSSSMVGPCRKFARS